MESDQEVTDGLRRKAKRASRTTVVFCFLLAIFWPVDAFFAWLFLGASVYFGFLTWYYTAQASPKEEPRWQAPESGSGTVNDGSRRIQFPIVIAIVVGLVFFGTFAFVVFRSGNTDESITNEVSVDNSSETSADVTDVDTPSADAITNRGNEFYEQGQYDSAMVYYDKVLLKDPSNQFAQYNKGLVYYSQKNYNRSVPTMLRCVREHPDYGEAYWLLGSNYNDRQRLDSARICFDRAYEKGVRNGGFLQLLASLYEPADRAKAIGLYQESLQQDSSLVDSYRKLIVLESGRAAEYQSKMKKWTKAN